MKDIIKNGFMLKKKEIYLSFIIFVYLVLSSSIIPQPDSNPVSRKSIFISEVFLLLFLLENYLTVSIYYGINQFLQGCYPTLSEIFRKGWRFFSRVLWYKVLAFFFLLIVSSFCLSMIELVKESSLLTAGLITTFTILWISFPVYLLLLTLYTPFIIVSDDIPLFTAMKTSMVFIRNNLKDIVLLLFIFFLLWGFAIFFLKLYNEKSFVLQGCVLYFLSLLEIITIKVFLVFYKGEVK
ncbi:MAG: hypothetical protein N3D17_07465 [bacterium]|nr:hypothetical protein [bacterium]